jgi:hypothetical protein
VTLASCSIDSYAQILIGETERGDALMHTYHSGLEMLIKDVGIVSARLVTQIISTDLF